MNYDVYILKDNVLYDVHKWPQREQRESPLQVFIPARSLGDEPLLFEGEPIYAFFYSNPNNDGKIKTLLELIFNQNLHEYAPSVREFKSCLPDDLGVLTKYGYRTKHRFILTQCAPDQNTTIVGSPATIDLSIFFNVLSKVVKDNKDRPYLDCLRDTLGLNVFGDFYYADQPDWYTKAVKRWESFEKKRTSMFD